LYHTLFGIDQRLTGIFATIYQLYIPQRRWDAGKNKNKKILCVFASLRDIYLNCYLFKMF